MIELLKLFEYKITIPNEPPEEWRWKKLKVDPNPDEEEDIEVESYMRYIGVRREQADTINILKTPEIDALTNEPLEVKYYVTTYIAFGDLEKSKLFDSFLEAKMYALQKMKEINNAYD
jgi:hypothetical protein